jgi:hypothetical protein
LTRLYQPPAFLPFSMAKSRPAVQVGSGARYRSQWHIDDSDGALLFGLGVHGQYLFVNAEKLVVAKGCCPRAVHSTLRA